MVFFRNAEMHTTTYTEVENSIGQVVKSYVKDQPYMANIQPIEMKQVEKVWGSDLLSTYQMYFDELLDVGDIISWNDKAYEIEKVIVWTNYRVYAIKESDVKVSES